MKTVFDPVFERAKIVDVQRPIGRAAAVLQWILVFGLFSLLVFAVLAYGAVEEWSTFTLEAGAAVLFLIWSAKQVVSREIRLSENVLYLPAILFFGLVLAQIVLGRSAYTYVTKFEALRYVSYGVMLLIAAECVKEERARKAFMLAMLVFGACYAFFALIQGFTSNGKVFWVHTPHFHTSSFYGTYIDRDHYAGLMEMLVPIPLVLGFGHLFRRELRALVLFGAVLMGTTIFLSGSRGGMIAFGLELAVFSALAFRSKRKLHAALGSIVLCVLVLGLLLFVGRGQVIGRLGDLRPGIRLQISKDCLRMFARRPVLGWGLETFPTVYPTFRSFYTNLFINEAHNDYAQLLVETGSIGFGLMLWFVIRLYQRGLPVSRRWEFKWDGALSLAALLGCTGLLFHSFVDFNLHIPANAALFYVLCGLAASKLPPSSSRLKRTDLPEPTAAAIEP
jgi:O-antigen ligase